MTGDSTKQRRTIKVIALGIIFILLVSALLIYLIVYLPYKKTYLESYEQFREMELQALPQFDSLNEQTYQELPEAPSNFKFLEKTTYGIDSPWHMGRWMTLSFLGPENNEDEFFEYYGEHLLNSNWMMIKEEEEAQIQAVSYYKDTSCIRLYVSVDVPSRYFIGIWQDFENQPFVSNIPNHEVFSFYLIDSWIIATCP